MSTAKRERIAKRQLGQYLTPRTLSRRIIDDLRPNKNLKILEPSFGDGSFLIAILDYCLERDISIKEMASNITGVEIDNPLFEEARKILKHKYGNVVLKQLNLYNTDFFRWGGEVQTLINPKKYFMREWGTYDLIVGNPPFGGTFDKEIEDELDSIFGTRSGEKIKKETYAFFIVKSLDLLKNGGRLIFICSDTFLTINTMKGLRNLLMESGSVTVNELSHFSTETTHPMVMLDFIKGKQQNHLSLLGEKVNKDDIKITPNYSWKLNSKYLEYFSYGKLLNKYIIATSGMTIGKNEYFIKKIHEDNTITDNYKYEFYDDPITFEKELSKARLGKLSKSLKQKIVGAENLHLTRENIRIVKRKSPITIKLPHKYYSNYNKGVTKKVYSPATHVVYWKDNGKAVYTFKKNGPWYLHGVGGKKFFKREGFTWQLVANKIYARYLPENYILDSGAPCGFLKEGVDKDELYFILAWLTTDTATRILKNILNHTRNIQGKDVERLPYPSWVKTEAKKEIILITKQAISQLRESPHSLDISNLTQLLDSKFALPKISS